MVVYVMEHYQYLYQMLTLRLEKHRNEDAILIGVRFNQKEPFFSNLKRSGLFKHVISYEDMRLQKEKKDEKEEKIIEKISNTYTELLRKNGLDITDLQEASTTYIGFDWFTYFAIYLDHLGIKFVTIETIPNFLRKKPNLGTRVHLKGDAPFAYSTLTNNALPFDKEGNVIKNVLIFPDSKLSGNSKYIETYDFLKKFDKLHASDKLTLISCFNVDVNFLKNNSFSILLPNGQPTTSEYLVKKSKALLYSKNKYELVYTILVDYFWNKKTPILFHPHPNRPSSAMKDSSLSQRGAIHLDTAMSVEFLRLIPNVKISQAFSLQTGAIKMLEGLIEEDINLGAEFLSVFHCMDKLYIIQKIINKYLESFKNIFCYGLPNKTVKTLYECNFNNYNSINFEFLSDLKGFLKEDNSIYIVTSSIDKNEPIVKKDLLLRQLKKASSNSIVFFVNSLHEYPFADLRQQDLMDYIVPIVINRDPIDEGKTLGDTGDTTVFAFCKNQEILQTFRNMNITKNLTFINVALRVIPLSKERNEIELRKCYEFAVNHAAHQKIYKDASHAKNLYITNDSDDVIKAYGGLRDEIRLLQKMLDDVKKNNTDL